VERTNDRGVYQFLDLAEGRYTLEITADGFESKIIGSIEIALGQAISMSPITLQVGLAMECLGMPLQPLPSLPLADVRPLPAGTRYGTLAGTVEAPERNPLGNARVSLICGFGRTCAKIETNSKGEFAFANLVPGTYSLKVAKAGFYPEQMARLTVREGTELVYVPIYLDECGGGCHQARPHRTHPNHLVICY
jgi:hypothetical protein